jgi:hypothetical protein
MNEAQWLNCTDPLPMLEHIKWKANDRKLRLFAVACCRRVWHLMTERASRRAVAVAERLADHPDGKKRSALRSAAQQVGSDATGTIAQAVGKAAADALEPKIENFVHGIRRFTAVASALAAARSCKETTRAAQACEAALLGEISLQGHLLHCIIGNPFRTSVLNPSWLSWRVGLLVSVAQRLYESRDFGELPILMDALEEAGCNDPAILEHGRQPPEMHGRGCFVVDLLLGKA